MNRNEEILNGQVGGNLTEGKGEQLLYREEVPNTPFQIIGQDGKYFVALGHYRLTELESDPELCRDHIYGMEWEFLLNVMTVLVTEIINEKLATAK